MRASPTYPCNCILLLLLFLVYLETVATNFHDQSCSHDDLRALYAFARSLHRGIRDWPAANKDSFQEEATYQKEGDVDEDKSAFARLPFAIGMASEDFMYGKVSDKIDVFAFGVILLELLTGRRLG
ncbi:hypothetical protein OPV22_003791 [Ensete ventricosum]|uniref:Serine-threonine/tyrosine-protein kinase catalytic domain-containing protein n=1 Tax=Ensete ventricosum TaxID=4639 RepID=A0AAV8S1L0_ENSVE|nr:hypothetical protein OPV22_003791 [Ensete ventricosum]